MNKRRNWLVVAVLALVLIGLASWPRRPPEPSYQGKRLSEWLQIMMQDHWHTNGADAVRAIGTNALPSLLERLSYRPSRIRVALIQAANKVFCDRLHLRKTHWVEPSLSSLHEAELGLYTLGFSGKADSAVPGLLKLMDKPAPNGEIATDVLLRSINPQGIYLVILGGLTNRSDNFRRNAFHGFRYSGSSSVGTDMEDVLHCLNMTNLEWRWAAISTMGSLPEKAAEVVPILTNLVADADYRLRWCALHSLGNLGSAAKPALPVITNALADADKFVREEATNTIYYITLPRAEPTPPR